MRWRYESETERRKKREQWHRWFAWHPVALTSGGECRWLEVIERREQLLYGEHLFHVGDYYSFPNVGWYSAWEYRPCQ